MANVGALTEPLIVDALTLVTHRRRYALAAALPLGLAPRTLLT